MLKKIQNVWNFIIKKKKITNFTNIYNIKNTFLFSNAISTSLVFFINSTNNLKLKKIKIIDKNEFLINYHRLTTLLVFAIMFSFLFYLFYLF